MVNGRIVLGPKYQPILLGLIDIWPYFTKFEDKLIIKSLQKVKTEEKTPYNVAAYCLRYCRENYKPVEDDFFGHESESRCDICDGIGSIDMLIDWESISLACTCPNKKAFEPYFKVHPPVYQFPWDRSLFPSYHYCYLSFYTLCVKAEYWLQTEQPDPWLFLVAQHGGIREAAIQAAYNLYEKAIDEIEKIGETEKKIVQKVKMPERTYGKKPAYKAPF